jgi:hypothetical protein
MAVYAMIICPRRQLTLWLGKPLRDKPFSDPDFRVISFHSGSEVTPVNSAQPQLNSALWKFLADTAGEEVTTIFDHHEDFETIAGWQLVGGDIYGIPFDDYLAGWDHRQGQAIAEGPTGASASLVCAPMHFALPLGHVLRDEGGGIIGFHLGDHDDPPNPEQPQASKSLWKFLADTMERPLTVVTDDQPDAAVITGYQQIGRDIPLADYLAGWDG